MSPAAQRGPTAVDEAPTHHAGPTTDNIARTVLLLIGAIVCALTWRKWGVVTVDCGHEMYVPMALSRGSRLYFDVWYAYGPLIPYWHALLFHLFGVQLWVLETAGIAIAGAMTLVIYSLSRMFLPVALSFTAAFAFILQAFQLRLFNYVLPYSYPAVYGSFLVVLLTFILAKDCFGEAPWMMFVAGFIAGVVAITKVEFGIAAYILIGVAIFMRTLRSRSFSHLMKDVAFCAPGLLLCLGVYGWYIHQSSFYFLFGQNMAILPNSYFMRSVGEVRTKAVGSTTSPLVIMECTVIGLLGVAIIAGAVRLGRSSRAARWLLPVVALLICALHLAVTYLQVVLHWAVPTILTGVAPFLFFNRGMVCVAAALAIVAMVRWRTNLHSPQHAALLILLAGAFAVGFRTIGAIQPTDYSMFYDELAFIAFLVALQVAGRAFFSLKDSERIWAWASAFLCIGLISLTVVYYPLHRRSFALRSARGTMYMEPSSGKPFSQALAFLNDAAAHSERFAAWPEEVALHYFTGTLAPSRWYHLTPGILPPGELTTRYLDELDERHVKYVALSNRGAAEYGLPIFGVDYNQQLYLWLQQNFRIVRTFGDYERIAYPSHWAVQIWERKTPR